jgi:hypothetical protein
MVPIAEKPEATEFSDGVKIGESPAGTAIKFLHRGAYDDIDSTYDLITVFLDEKGLESQNRFVEEYLTDTTEPDDDNLEADIYVEEPADARAVARDATNDLALLSTTLKPPIATRRICGDFWFSPC